MDSAGRVSFIAVPAGPTLHRLVREEPRADHRAGEPGLASEGPPQYALYVISDLAAYRRLREAEDLEALRSLTVEQAIAIGEDLLTSELMDLAEFPDDDHPQSLAIRLGLSQSWSP